MPLGPAPARRRGVAHPRRYVSLAFEPVEGGIERAHRHGPLRSRLNQLSDRDAIDIFLGLAQMRDGEQNGLFEFTQGFGLGHLFCSAGLMTHGDTKWLATHVNCGGASMDKWTRDKWTDVCSA